MNHSGRVAAFSLLLGWLFLTTAWAEDWPQWRGPDRTGISRETGLLESWPPAGPRQLWTFENCGIGFSGPAVVGERLYIMGGRGGVEQLLALDVSSGEELWSLDVGEVFENRRGNGPRSTPTVAGDRVYSLGAQGNLVCASAVDGKLIWQVSMIDLGGTPPNWGYSESVLVDGRNVICSPGGPSGAMAALDASTGKVIWRSEDFTDAAQYASSIAIDWNGFHQYVQLYRNSLVGIDSGNGRLLWKSDWPGRTAVVPTPIYWDGHVYITSGYGVGCKLVRLGDTDNPVSDVYANKIMKNHHGGTILMEGHVYGYSDGRGWTCQDFKNGEIVWNEKELLGKGSLTYADGRFYCLSEKEGEVVMIDAGSAGWEEHGRFRMTPDSELRRPEWLIWTHPVISNGRLYLRNQELLFSYDLKAD